MSMMSKNESKRKEVETKEEEKIYVAVGNKVKESKSALVWALQNSGGKRVCILHVHQPAQMIPSPMGYFPADRVGKEEVKAYREKERKEMSKVLDEYLHLCLKAGVRIEKLHTEANSIEEGIIQFIIQHRIGRLVMGAAADKHRSRTMTELKSKKAIYVREHAPCSCHIWFVCKGYLIYTRTAVKLPTPDGGENGLVNSEGSEGASPTAPPFDIHDWSPPRFSADTDDSPIVSRTASDREPAAGWLGPLYHPSPGYYSPARTSESGAVPESVYLEECRRRKEIEAELVKVKEEHLYMKNYILGELRSVMEQKSFLESQIGNSTFLLKMLGEKVASTIKLVDNQGEQ